MPVAASKSPSEPGRINPWVATVILPLALFVAAGTALMAGGWFLSRDMFYDRTKRSPLLPFHTHLGVVPPGISDVRSAGMEGLGGSDIFLRFRATDAGVAALSKSFGPDEQELDPNQLEMWDWQFDKGVLRDQGKQPFEHQVHWEELRRIRHPRVYQRQHSETSWDLLIWDSEHHRAYFYHMNT